MLSHSRPHKNTLKQKPFWGPWTTITLRILRNPDDPGTKFHHQAGYKSYFNRHENIKNGWTLTTRASVFSVHDMALLLLSGYVRNDGVGRRGERGRIFWYASDSDPNFFLSYLYSVIFLLYRTGREYYPHIRTEK